MRRTCFGCLRHVDADDLQRSRGRSGERGDRADQRGLAGAVGAEHREHLPEGTARSRPASASTSPKCFWRPSASIIMSMVGSIPTVSGRRRVGLDRRRWSGRMATASAVPRRGRTGTCSAIPTTSRSRWPTPSRRSRSSQLLGFEQGHVATIDGGPPGAVHGHAGHEGAAHHARARGVRAALRDPAARVRADTARGCGRAPDEPPAPRLQPSRIPRRRHRRRPPPTSRRTA